jgi:hypothetical protein
MRIKIFATFDKETPKTENRGGLISVVVKAYDPSDN